MGKAKITDWFNFEKESQFIILLEKCKETQNLESNAPSSGLKEEIRIMSSLPPQPEKISSKINTLESPTPVSASSFPTPKLDHTVKICHKELELDQKLVKLTKEIQKLEKNG